MSRPNIIVILADDMGYGDVSYQNPESKIKTPSIDKLAAEGMYFTDAHAPSALCTPSRYGLLTGRYCWRSRLKRGVFSGYDNHLIEVGRMTIGSMLQQKGYNTACIGKWHLGWDWQKEDSTEKQEGNFIYNIDFNKPILNGPTTFGFDWFYGIPASLDMPPFCYVENDHVTGIPNNKIKGGLFNSLWREGVIASNFNFKKVLPHLTDKAIEYIIENGQSVGEKPFFLYFALPAPHTPIVPADEFKGKSEDGEYGDFCIQVDSVVGKMLDALNKIGVIDNTLFIFTSDNGPERTAYERAKRYYHFSMGNLRGVKRDNWEGGHRVPFIVRWPSKIKKNSVSNETICLTDIFATIAEITGTKLPKNTGEDSYSIVAALVDDKNKLPIREEIIHHSGSGRFAIRKGSWIFIDAPTGDDNREPEWFKKKRGYMEHNYPGELYHLGKDLIESNNLYSKYPEKVKELKHLLEKHKKDRQAE